MYACNKIPLLFLITWVKVKWNLGAFCVTWRDFTHGRSLVRSSRPPDPKSSCRTHPDGLLAQPGAPRQLGTSLHWGVLRDLEQRLELLDLTVSEHRPHPELVKRLRGHRRGLRVSAVSRQRLHIWGGGPEMLLAKKESDKTEAWISQQTHPDCD